MWMTRRLLLTAFVLASLGCATRSAEPPADVSGLWSGTITLGATSKLSCAGGAGGAVHLVLEQDGERLSGSVTGVGFYGSLTAFVRGTELVGDFRYSAGLCAASSHFSATVSGNEMLAETAESKLIFSRTR